MTAVVAIHQPNYAPWLGYFYKIARAGIFVFLDDADYSKNSFTNRVQVLNGGRAHWLTIPVSAHLGQSIRDVASAKDGWVESHLAALENFYRHAARFPEVWPSVRGMYDGLGQRLGAINETLILRAAERLGLAPRFVRASDVPTDGAKGDDRLIRLVTALAPGGTYLSGRGGAKYQDESKFGAAGLSLMYSDFAPVAYDQGGGASFTPGLSILDAVFHLGWDNAARLLRS